MKKLWLIPIAMLLVLGLAACGGDDADDDEPSGPPEVAVDLGEWYVNADPTTVAAGDITFNAKNEGALPHELVVISTDLAADALVVENAVVDEAQVGTVIGEIEPDQLPKGASASATFTMTAGSYVLFCNIPAHYEQGMYTGFTVE